MSVCYVWELPSISPAVKAEQTELSQLCAENKRLQMAIEIAKNGGGVLREGPPAKDAWIDGQCRRYPLSALCEILSVRVNGWHCRAAAADRHAVAHIDPVDSCRVRGCLRLAAHDGGEWRTRVPD
ncbi:protein of unknown function (plasmid) [Cupriavidus taiwanensis]|uniref:Uncharacterized protein n=1 Tax=Cupriavidus taiwanensis TaxID=164546 RepID=A0A375FM46_9BURK|nr:protein of unknown function [Cupriavidus taiwanensis]SOZ72405.1 protein of unknown function [Cupriavidus taiwanensis]SOZ74766.1 protein of unknown function [Cupriavidus taiwanensis]SPA03607.1 protein of unknown function [Cupriavidus taiwanensis]SPA11508.1 protein of unknown function [Cupriavidus taiwanensis]